jgi:hypothetical protein
MESSKDKNTNLTVQIGEFDSCVVIKTISSAEIAFNPVITAPIGATDNIISTGQKFILQADVDFVTSVADTGRVARIWFSNPGYGVANSVIDIPPILDRYLLEWEITAPGVIPQNPVPDSINVEVRAIDKNSGRDTTITRTRIVNLVAKSDISLNISIDSPDGAKDNVLSSKQRFDINVVVADAGQAGFDSTGSIELELTNGLRFLRDSSTTTTIDSFRSVPISYVDSVFLSEGTISPARVIARMVNVPNDVNTDTLVFVTKDRDSLSIAIIDRAELRLFSLMPSSVIRSTNQEFDILANVIKSGEARVDADSGYAVLDLSQSPNIQLLSPVRQKYAIGDSIFWRIKAPDNEVVSKVYFRVEPLENGSPRDVNDEQYAFRTASAQIDSLILDINRVGEPSISAQYTEPKVKQDSLTVSTDQDSIMITASVTLDSLLDINRLVVLTLPQNAGYTALDSSRSRTISKFAMDTTLTWYIGAPRDAISWRQMELLLSAASSFNPDTTVSASVSLNIETESKAELTLVTAIIDPPGASGGNVSEEQEFTVEAQIANRGNAQVEGQGLIAISSKSDQSLLTFLTDDTVAYTAGDNITWPIYVNSFGSTANNKLNHLISELRSVNDEATALTRSRVLRKAELIQQIQEVIAESLVVSLVTRPLDENTVLPAAVLGNSSREIPLLITSPAKISVDSINTEYLSTVSTGQLLRFTAKFNRTENVTNAFGEILLPVEFGTVQEKNTLSDNDTVVTVIWNIETPGNLLAATDYTIGITYEGEDQFTNSPILFVDTTYFPVFVQPKAQIRIDTVAISPSSLKSGFVSKGEKIVVEAQVLKDSISANGTPIQNMADYEGTVGVRVLIDSELKPLFNISPSEYQSADASIDTIFTWTLIAPDSVINPTTIAFVIDSLPRDANSGLSVVVQGNRGTIPVPISVRENQIRITNEFNRIDSLRSFSRGAHNVPLMAFKLENPGSGQKVINVDELTFTFKNSVTSDPLLADEVGNMIDSIQIVNWPRYTELKATDKINYIPKRTSIPLDLGGKEISLDGENPVELETNQFKIDPGQYETVVMMVNFSPGATIRNFYVILDDIDAWDTADSIQVDKADSTGAPFSSENVFEDDPPIFSISPASPKEAFGNFPNPFGRNESETTIQYFVETQSDVIVRIFTITGKLVRTFNLGSRPQGLHTDLKWDGRNDRGQVVLNGVYLCQIQIKGGASDLTFMTKIAYIK